MRQVMYNLGSTPFKQRLQQSLNQPISFYSATANQPWSGNLFQPNLSTDLSSITSTINTQQAQQLANQSKMNFQNATGISQIAGNVANQISSFLPEATEYSGTRGSITRGMDTAYDSIANGVSALGPYGQLIGGIMKGGALINKGLKSLGAGTDGQTTADAILGSNFFGLTPVGLVNGIFGKRTKNFYRDNDAMAQVGGDYQGSNTLFGTAADKANKKYGLFSSGARKRANGLISNAQTQMNKVSDISDWARNVLAQDGMANYQLYQLRQNGGVQATQVAACGAKLRIKRVCRKINKKLKGGRIEPKPFEPTIILEDSFKPVINLDEPIKFQKGGKTADRTLEQLIAFAKAKNPRFIQRMSEPLRYIELPDGTKATHKLGWATATFDGEELPFVYPEIQENEKGELVDYGKEAPKRALQNNNILVFNTPTEAELFTNSNDLNHGYKSGWKDFFTPFYKDGGIAIQITVVDKSENKTDNKSEDKNVIPEGALHARKHNIENTKSLTQKGIPVVNDKGEQQAEIEKDEVILNLKLTNKLEELQKKYENASKSEQNKLALEAGKLLVEELLHNTIDNTGLIDKCKEGGKINGLE